MEQNQNPFTPEAATDEPASPVHPVLSEGSPELVERVEGPVPAPAADEAEERDPLGHPVFATEAEDSAYWRGLTAGLRMAEPAPPEAPGDPPFETRRQRRARYDGFTGPKRAVFLEGLADGMTVAAAAAAAQISPTAAYNLRNRREGRAFDIAWEAATRRSRKVLADRYRDRAIEGQVTTRYDKDGNVVGTRHYHDNRLAMAVLTRLDAKVAAYRDDERLVTAVSEAFEELLDCIEEGGDAEAFVEARRPQGHEANDEQESDASMIARLNRLHRLGGADPEDIDISDLDPADIDEWTDDQWDRAEASGFLDTLPDDEEEEEEMEDREESSGECSGDDNGDAPPRHSREGGNPGSAGEEEQD